MASILSVHSFRGGTGKSNTTANLAAVFAGRALRVCVIDTDIQSPGIHVLFGVEGDAVHASLNDYLWHDTPIPEMAMDVTGRVGLRDGGQIFLIMGLAQQRLPLMAGRRASPARSRSTRLARQSGCGLRPWTSLMCYRSAGWERPS